MGIEEKMNQFERIHDRIKHKSFGKIKISRKVQKKGKIEIENRNEKDAKSMFEEEERLANQEIGAIKKKRLSKVGEIWEVGK